MDSEVVGDFVDFHDFRVDLGAGIVVHEVEVLVAVCFAGTRYLLALNRVTSQSALHGETHNPQST